jgi:hypothetical protein
MVFDPACGHAAEAIPTWKTWTAQEHPGLRVLALTSGSQESWSDYLASFHWRPEVWRVGSEEGVGNKRSITARTPWVFLLDEDGVILAEGHGKRIGTVTEGWADRGEQPKEAP